MLIICPKCSAKYRLPDEITLKNDQKLKCSMCQILFTAEESAPLDLTQDMLDNETVVDAQRAESTPVHEMIETPAMQNNPPPMWAKPVDRVEDVVGAEIGRLLSEKPADIVGRGIASQDALPEVFVPVTVHSETPKKKKGIGIVAFYLLLISGFCFAAWTYRQMLMPSFYNFMPTKVERVKSVKNISAPVVKPIEKVVKKPTVVNKPMSTETVKKVPDVVVAEVKAVEKEVKANPQPMVKSVDVPKTEESSKANESVVNVQQVAPIVPETDPVTSPVTAAKKIRIVGDVDEKKSTVAVPVIEGDGIKPKNSVGEDKNTVIRNDVVGQNPPVVQGNTVVISETEQIPSFDGRLDDEPLLDVMAEPVPTALENELIIESVRFNVAPDEQGIEQMLIEGVVVNKAKETRSVPVLTATVWDENNHMLEQKKVHVTQEHLNPDETIAFYTSLVPAPNGVHHVDVTF